MLPCLFDLSTDTVTAIEKRSQKVITLVYPLVDHSSILLALLKVLVSICGLSDYQTWHIKCTCRFNNFKRAKDSLMLSLNSKSAKIFLKLCALDGFEQVYFLHCVLIKI